MARSTFGGTTADWVYSKWRFGQRDLLALGSGARLDIYSAKTGGTHYTDLLDANGGACSFILFTGYQVPVFQGPDGVIEVWADDGDGGDRERMISTNVVAIAASAATATAAATSATASATSATASAAASTAAVSAEVTRATAAEATKVDKDTLVTNVEDYGVSVAGSASANVTGILAAFAASNGKVLFPGVGDYQVNAVLPVPFNVTEIELGAGARVLQTANTNIFTRTGTWGTTESLGATIVQGNRTATVADATVYPVKSWILCHGTNVVGTDKFGYLRCITSVTAGTSAIFDATIPRQISTSPRITPIQLAPSLAITGRGSVGYDVPASNTVEAIHFLFTENPIFTATVSGGGSSGVRYSHCVGGLYDGHAEDLLDDDITHYGYGVNVSGATRDLVVRGSATRVRHAVTTNAGPALSGFVAFVGEPESCLFAIRASNTTNKAIDTHRLGYGIIIEPNVHGGSGGVQIRADATVVKGGLISGCSGVGIFVSSVVDIAPTITSPTILWQRTTGPSILVESDTILTNPRIRNFFNEAITVSAGAKLHLSGGEIDAGSTVAGTGISIAGDGSRIEGIRIHNCTTGINETAGTDNEWSNVEFFGCTTNETRATVYTQRRIATRGRSVSSGPVKSASWIAAPSMTYSTGGHCASGTLSFAPIDIPSGVTLTKLAAEVTTLAASSLLRLGIYHSDVDGLPGALLAEAGTIDGGTVAVAEVAFGTPPVIRGGTYWLAALSEVGNPSVRKSQCLSTYGTTATDAIASVKGCFFATGVSTGSLPATAPALTSSSAVARVAAKIQ